MPQRHKATLPHVLLVLLALPVWAQTPPADLEGRWSGAYIEQGTPTLFDLELRIEADTLAATLTQPYNGFSRFRIGSVRYEDGHVRTALFGDLMDLRHDPVAGNLLGTITEDDSVTARVFLKKVIDFPLPEVSRREVRVPAGRDTLGGFLYLPEGSGPHPAIAYVPGRGATTRYSMADMAGRLARIGFAGVILDARGTGSSTGTFETITSTERFADLRANLDFLAGQPEIDPSRVGVLSNSAGGWVAPVVIAEREDVRFWVSIVGPAEGLAEQQGHVIQALMQQAGDSTLTPSDYAAADAYTQELVRLMQAGALWPDVEPVVDEARDSRWWPYVDQPVDLTHPELSYFRSRPGFGAPEAAIRQLDLPILAVYGEKDIIVDPIYNVPKLRAATAGNPNVTILELPEANHSLGLPSGFRGEGEWPQRYYQGWSRPPAYYVTLVEWLRPFTDR
ncbi:MAG: alpha/beta fold hydrolase [Bacteroidota bacterium]